MGWGGWGVWECGGCGVCGVCGGCGVCGVWVVCGVCGMCSVGGTCKWSISPILAIVANTNFLIGWVIICFISKLENALNGS
jgi:hypothetical protein